jgi:hypothetical protein
MSLLYTIDVKNMKHEEFACRCMSAEYVTDYSKFAKDIGTQVQLHGYVRVINGKYLFKTNSHALEDNWEKTFFSSEHFKYMGMNTVFEEGQRASEKILVKWVDKNHKFRRLDQYTNKYYLLPNNEVSYTLNTPSRVIMYCNSKPKTGGRPFIHSVEEMDKLLSRDNKCFMDKYEKHGIRLTFGYLHTNDPIQKSLYTPSWNEKFGDDAIELIRTNKSKFIKEHNLTDVEVKNNDNHLYILTHINLPGFIYTSDKTRRFFRPPRIAITEPAAVNGFRQFTFGDGTKFTKQERQAIVDVYLKTRCGIEWETKDFIVFDNITHCVSKENHDGTSMEIYVAMANEVNVLKSYDIDIPSLDIHAPDTPVSFDISSDEACCYWGFGDNLNTNKNSQQRQNEANNQMWKEHTSMMIFDVKNRKINKTLSEKIKNEFKRHSKIHMINTLCKTPDEIDNTLTVFGFTKKSMYGYGGVASGRTPRSKVTNKTKGVDKYPKELFLLPHNEILYQRGLPKQLFFACINPSIKGGRTFSHSSKLFEHILSKISPELLHKILNNRMNIHTSFFSKSDPTTKKAGYFLVSWEDKFGVDVINITIINTILFDLAKNKKYSSLEEYLNDKLKKYKSMFTEYLDGTDDTTRIKKMQYAKHMMCRAIVDKFDECKWGNNNGFPYLETKVNISLVKTYDNERYLFFPRIQYDISSIKNGNRNFYLNDTMITHKERNILLSAFWLTREGFFYKPGDMQLIDNIKTGHSRESYRDTIEYPRRMAIAMGGTFWSDDIFESLNTISSITDRLKMCNSLQKQYPFTDIFEEPTYVLSNYYKNKRTTKRKKCKGSLKRF